MYILWFKDISSKDVPLVGGKNASLGEMLSKLSKKGISVPDGFVLTTEAYWHFLKVFPSFLPKKHFFLQPKANPLPKFP